MQKIILILCVQLLCVGSIWAQFYNDGVPMSLDANAILYCDGDFTNGVGGAIENSGMIITTGDFLNEGVFDAIPNSTLKFDGDDDKILTMGNDALRNLIIDIGNDAVVTLGSQLAVLQNMNFVGNSSFVDIGDFHLFLSFAADIDNTSQDNFIITSGEGLLKKSGLGVTDFTFPVGYDKDTFNPVYINQDDVSETIGVRALEDVKDQGPNGVVLNEKVVKAMWEISESHAGDNDFTIECYWTGDHEAPLFNRAETGISRWDGNNWSMLWEDVLPATPIGGYYYHIGNFDEVGFFAIGNEPLAHAVTVSMKAFLKGPFDQGEMDDYIRVLDEFPLIEPYSAIPGFTPVKYGGNEEMTIGQLGNANGVVDWMFMELRDKNDNTQVVGTKALLVYKNGVIVDVEGNEDFSIKGVPSDDYYIALRHRNHLGICTANTYPLSAISTHFDFTDGSVPLYGNNATAMADGKEVMIAGDTNHDNEVKYNGLNNDRNQVLSICGLLTPGNSEKGYFLEDLNLDGFVEYTGSGNDQDVILKTVGLPMPNNVVVAQLPE